MDVFGNIVYRASCIMRQEVSNTTRIGKELGRYSVIERKLIRITCFDRLLEFAHLLCPSEATRIA